MKRYLLLLALVCLLGNRVLAQTKSASNTSFTHEVYDFRNIPQTQQTTNTTNVWSGTQTFGQWGQTAMFNINNNGRFTVSEGDIIRVSFTNAGNDRQGRIKPIGSYDELIDYNSFRYGNDYYEATIAGSAANNNSVNVADYINSNGFGIQAQNMTITSVDIISASGNDGGFRWNGNYLVSISGTTFPKADRISVSSTDGWQIWTSDENQCSYLQRETGDVRYFYINNLNVGDVVRIWCQGDCRILTDNTATHDSSNPLVWNHIDPDPYFNEQQEQWGRMSYYDRDVNNREGVQLKETLYRTREDQNSDWEIVDRNPDGNELRIVNDHDNGTLVIKMNSRWAGILKVEIDAVTTNPRFDYDPGFEVYDMWATNVSSGSSDITATESADFKLNNNEAYYLKLTNNDLTLNARFAVNSASGWRFQRGLQAPNYGNTNNDWYNLSICNLREGDRVVIYYSGDAPIFSSNGKDGGYTGSAAYKDTWNDGMLDENEGDYVIKNGDPVEYSYCRKEGTFGNEEGTNHIWLYTSYPYVMKENGHLDLALRNGNHTRIVKIKIYSDHQAMMVDDYIKADYAYKAYFDITGQLQAKEHVVPGGLEVRVGNDNADQHAIVVFSKEGPVSYVNAVNRFKLPGIKEENGQIVNDFYLANHAPETGTYYRFIPEVSGTMTVRFKAASLNYYRWDLAGDAIYWDDSEHPDFNGNSGWTEEYDRANEWPIDRDCPYYLKVQDGNNYYQPSDLKVSYNDGASFSTVGNNTLQIHNGTYCTLTLNVVAGKTYYLYGAWSGDTYTAITPRDDNNWISNDDRRKRDACGVAELLWVEFKADNSIYPLAKWVPSGTPAVNVPDEDHPNGHPVPNPDTFALEYELADVVGYVGQPVTVKKMSGNITACRPYIDYESDGDGNSTTGKLMIDGIEFATGQNPGGTILIKVGDPSVRANPLYALTIAYSTDPKYDNQQGTGKRGHSWDMSTQSLNALTWDLEANEFVKPDEDGVFHSTSTGYASVSPLGTYFTNYFGTNISNYSSAEAVESALTKNTSSLLHKEIQEHSDWMFNYNLVYGGKLYDPVFTNKYDMEGDNADMVWDTEGTVFKTSANQSVIFNEFGSNVTDNTTNDPDRYIGILEGGEFRIPWLMPNDRVIIWMGTGKGRYADEVKFNIRNAYDALHNPISESDDYIVGGSQWTSEGNSKYGYHGCYHFFATGQLDANGNPVLVDEKPQPADMVFNMKEGSMCKIYKIQIYRGDRIITNEIVGKTEDDKFLLVSTADDPNDTNNESSEGNEGNGGDEEEEEEEITGVVGGTYNWTLQYLGKNQQMANSTGKNKQKNEIIAQTGKYNSTAPALTINYKKVAQENTETGETEQIATDVVESFTYQHQLGEIGTFRMRGKDMEKNMNYVADYADHNVTVAYQQTQPYPYTWDFMDMTGFDNIDNLYQLEENIGEVKPAGLDEDVWNSLANTSYQKTSRDLSLWEVNGTEGECFLRLNSQSQTLTDLKERDNIFETAMAVDGNQFWANGQVVPETQGLWFYTGDNYRDNCEWYIDSNGMKFNGYNGGTLVVPNVPAGAAVYLRMAALKPDVTKCTFTHQFKDKNGVRTCEVYDRHQVGSTNEYIFAILNDGDYKGNLTLSIEGYQLKKLAVSTDAKQIAQSGYATESRANDIDHQLTSYLTGLPIKAYTATLTSDHSKVLLTQFGANETSKKILPDATKEGAIGGCILYHEGYVTTTNGDKDHTASILGGGFHEFVPDMHDKVDANLKVTTTDNIIIPFMPARDKDENIYAEKNNYLKAIDGNYTNMILSTKKYNYGENGAEIENNGYDAFFVRVDPNGNGGKGAKMWKCSGYIQILTGDLKNLTGNTNTNGAKMSIVFADDFFEDIVTQGIATGINDASEENAVDDKAEWYSLDGRKLNGAPTTKGLYIVNGKKVLVK